MAQSFKPQSPTNERAVLVGVDLFGGDEIFSMEDSLEELAVLARTADVEVVGRVTQRLDRPHPATLIGPGKLEELKDAVALTDANVVIFDRELPPRQQRELEEALNEHVKVIDRTTLILDIFARHAHTREGALQVALAQYRYRLPRLTRRWTHLSRQTVRTAAGVGLRGPGETQLEVDRRAIRRQITRLEKELEEVRKQRRVHRQQRRRAVLPVVALVGYTNAGKSTLLNALADADVLVADKLFATLDPTTRRIALPGGREILVTDTVGFIQKLPPTLVAAFRATLEEVEEADVLLHVVDITHPHVLAQAEAVGKVLEDLGVTDKPMVVALNKIDVLSDPNGARRVAKAFPNSVAISAARKIGLDELRERLKSTLEAQLVQISVSIPYTRGDLVSLFHQRGVIESEEHGPEGTTISGLLPVWLLPRFHGVVKRENQRRD